MQTPLSSPRFLALMLFTSLGLGAINAASAQNSLEVLATNGSIAGEADKLAQLGDKVMATQCTTPQCHLSIPPTRFSVSAPGQHTMRVVVTRLSFPRNVKRLSDIRSEDDTSSRPILLRGRATIRHADSGGRSRTVPIAGTVFRDRKQPILELAIPQLSGRNTPDNLRNIIVRTPLNDVRLAQTANARAVRLPTTAFRNRSCGLRDTYPAPNHAPQASAPQRYPGGAMPGKSGSDPVASPATLRIFYLGTDYDSQYAARLGCGTAAVCKNQILALVNQAAVYYEDQFASTLEVARQYGPTSISSATNAETLLDAFARLNSTSRASVIHNGRNTSENQVDLFQLFTGKDLDSNIIGLAYLEVMCRNSRDWSDFASMLVQFLANSVNQLIVAHETGHTLGANHTIDGSGIMGAALSNPLPTSFSEESVTEISTHISRYYGECRGGTRDTTRPTPTPVPTTGPTQTPTPRSTTVPGATPTPTGSGGGGGGGSGSGGGDPAQAPVTLGLSASQSKSGLVSITTTTTTSRLCSITVRAAASEDAVLNGKAVAQFDPLSNLTTLKGSVPLRVQSRNNKNPVIYFYAVHSCSDGTNLERSLIKKVNPNRITARNARTTSASAWISRLSKVLG